MIAIINTLVGNAMSDHSQMLARVYNAKTQDDLSLAYGEWARRYDRDLLEDGYILPFFVTSFVARYLPKGAGPILDAGVGTGLTGPYLAALGYVGLAGTDMSDEMLEMARARGCYDDLKQAVLGETLPWPDDHFAAFISAGVFTTGHAPSSCLDELVRITRQGGYAIFNIRQSVFEENGFAAKLLEQEKAGLVKPVEVSPPFAGFAYDKDDILGSIHVLQIL
jgi:predicted TPR repeat methyltransferase